MSIGKIYSSCMQLIFRAKIMFIASFFRYVNRQLFCIVIVSYSKLIWQAICSPKFQSELFKIKQTGIID
jgi:hypothetical protein